MLKRGRYIDVSGRAIVSLVGPESLDLLQRISTNDVSKLNAGGTIQTVLTNDKGRIVEVISVLDQTGSGLLVVGQAKDSSAVRQWIEKFIIMEDITVVELSDEFVHFMLYDAMSITGNATRRPAPYTGRFIEETLASVQLTHVLVPKASSGEVMQWLSDADFVQCAHQDYEEYRVMNGIPGFPQELSSSYNPLEAGLQPLVSFTKGCYVGQEVVARLDTYKKVQRQLTRFKLDELPLDLPEQIYVGGKEWGNITSAVQMSDTREFRGLGYVKTGNESFIDGMYFLKGGNQIKLTVDVSAVLPSRGR
jgi:folate-binding protein YgfZ